MLGFFKGFWPYVTTFEWWQGLIIIIAVLITFFIGKYWKNVFSVIENIFKKGRSCGDCIVILFSKETKHRAGRNNIMGHILEEQMLLASQKIDGLYLKLITNYREDIIMKRDADSVVDYITEEKEYSLYREMLSNAFDMVIKEIRRSMKENGFHDIDGKLFSEYVKNMSSHLADVAKMYIMDRYPEHMTVPLLDIMKKFSVSSIEDIIFDIYINAKEIRNNAERAAIELDEKFVDEIDEFVKNK